MAYGQRDDNGGWRVRYKRPDGTWASKSGFSSEKKAEEWGNEQEALIRRHMWIDPRDGETPFATFASDMLDAIGPRLEPSTLAKYRSHLETHLLPQWSAWPMIGIFNNYVEIEKWISELHEDYAESTVSSVFATFSTILNSAVRARNIPANPCSGIRVTSGEFETERLVASPVQGLRAAIRLHATAGLAGVVLCLMDLYTGARWGELTGQQRHEYDHERQAIGIAEPLKEIGGQLFNAPAIPFPLELHIQHPVWKLLLQNNRSHPQQRGFTDTRHTAKDHHHRTRYSRCLSQPQQQISLWDPIDEAVRRWRRLPRWEGRRPHWRLIHREMTDIPGLDHKASEPGHIITHKLVDLRLLRLRRTFVQFVHRAPFNHHRASPSLQQNVTITVLHAVSSTGHNRQARDNEHPRIAVIAPASASTRATQSRKLANDGPTTAARSDRSTNRYHNSPQVSDPLNIHRIGLANRSISD
jgi:hypothetical protein